ncbi:MAG: LON peptidase substrate-binding domain-containing protein, partial [Pirellulaceae bacterium]
MSIAEANLDLPSNFTGVVKLFPLPNLVLFPGVIQPLHIFEPRYRKLMEDAISSDQVIAMAMLKPGWENKQAQQPELYKTLCIGKIVTHAQLPDGRYNLLLLGAKRARIIREIAADQPYRLADVQLIEAADESHQGVDAQRIREQAIHIFEELTAVDSELDHESIANLLHDDLPFGLLLDLMTFSSGLPLEQQQSVLETVNID